MTFSWRWMLLRTIWRASAHVTEMSLFLCNCDSVITYLPFLTCWIRKPWFCRFVSVVRWNVLFNLSECTLFLLCIEIKCLLTGGLASLMTRACLVVGRLAGVQNWHRDLHLFSEIHGRRALSKGIPANPANAAVKPSRALRRLPWKL